MSVALACRADMRRLLRDASTGAKRTRRCVRPPGAAAAVRILPIVGATRSDRFVAVISRDGRAEHTRPCSTAVEAVLL